MIETIWILAAFSFLLLIYVAYLKIQLKHLNKTLQYEKTQTEYWSKRASQHFLKIINLHKANTMYEAKLTKHFNIIYKAEQDENTPNISDTTD